MLPSGAARTPDRHSASRFTSRLGRTDLGRAPERRDHEEDRAERRERCAGRCRTCCLDVQLAAGTDVHDRGGVVEGMHQHRQQQGPPDAADEIQQRAGAERGDDLHGGRPKVLTMDRIQAVHHTEARRGDQPRPQFPVPRPRSDKQQAAGINSSLTQHTQNAGNRGEVRRSAVRLERRRDPAPIAEPVVRSGGHLPACTAKDT